MRLNRPAIQTVLMMILAALSPGIWAAGVQSRPVDGAGEKTPFVMVLGIAQDGGYPQAGCKRKCCVRAWADPSLRRSVASLAIVDPAESKRWLIDATPDFKEELREMDEAAPAASSPGLDGILLTHAHIGHYLGLAQLGREAMGAKGVAVYGMPKMRGFLENSGPWSQLIKLGNITLFPIEADKPLKLDSRITVTPLPVPHRDEYSETVGYLIQGPARTVLYLPDIDKWEKWSLPLEKVLAGVDVAYLDGTFYDEGELPGRNMAEIPHPFIVETMARLKSLGPQECGKVRFIHLNHTNPALDSGSEAAARMNRDGLRVASERERFGL